MILPNFAFLYLWIITITPEGHFTSNTITDFHFYCNIISKILHFSVTNTTTRQEINGRQGSNPCLL